MWSSLQSNPHAQPRLVSNLALQAMLDEPGDEVAQAYGPSLFPSGVARGHARHNMILAALSESQFAEVQRQLEPVNLSSGQVIYESGGMLQHVYFPTTCTASLVSNTADGDTAELALTGRNGLIGVPLVLGATSMGHSVQIQCAGQAWRMSAERFLRWMRESEQFKQLALSYVQSLMTQMAQSIVCSRHHSVSERLSQWMLWNSDGLGTQELTVTHETIAHMLGVRRESVTQAAGKLQTAGCIRNSRGKITILNREGLLASVCECYDRIKSDANRYTQRLAQLTDLPMSSGVSYGMEFDDDEQSSDQGDLQKYVDAYDFAPVGFVTLNAQAQVIQTNLAGAIMLDIQRSQCQHTPFVALLDEPCRGPFMAFHQEVLSGQCRRFFVVTLPATQHRSAVTLRIHATSDESGQENRMVMIDIGADLDAPAQQEAHRSGAWQFRTTSLGPASAFKV